MDIQALEGSRPEDVRRWEELVEGAPLGDVYHRPGYVRAHAATGHGRAVALVVSSGGRARLLVPLLIRHGLPLPGGETVTDAFSPYGYGGLLSLHSLEPPSLEEMAGLVENLQQWCVSQGVVCCVLRLHPLLRQQTWFHHLDSAQHGMLWHFRGPTVALDLANWDDDHDCPLGMRKGRHSDLKLARKLLRVTWSDARDPESVAAHVKRFREIYDLTMSRLGAESFYDFPAEYYTALAAGLGEHLGVAVAWQGEEPVGTAIFLHGRHYAHYHLSGTTDEGRRTKAASLLVNGGAAWARQRGCRLLHLGGGVRGDDSLLEFKRGFGGQTYNYMTLSIVTDQLHYELLRQSPDPPWPYRRLGAPSATANIVSTAGEARAPLVRIRRDRHPLGVVFLGKDKPTCVAALRYLVSSGVRVSAVVGPLPNATAGSGQLRKVAASFGIPTSSDQRLYEQIAGAQNHGLNLSEVDLVISFLFWKRIKRPLIELGKMGCINFHPAPLPEFRGVGGYNLAIYEEHKSWGAAAHFVDETFDTGDLIRVDRFSIDPARETAFSLEQKTLIRMLHMFKELISGVLAGQALPRKPQSEGRYISKEEFERVRRITAEDTPDQVARKIRAFWYPPQQGAFIEIDGQEFTLVGEELLRTEINDKYRG
jgi:methionyl-tRNA formyltransferase